MYICHEVTEKIRSKLAGLNFGLLSLSTSNARTPSKKFLSLKYPFTDKAISYTSLLKFWNGKCNGFFEIPDF